MHKLVAARIALIADDAWQPVPDYPDSGVCELAETTLGEDRLIVRRVHLHAQDDQTELFTYWRHFAFITNRTEPIYHVDSEHRQHAQVELVIRDLEFPRFRGHLTAVSTGAAERMSGCAQDAAVSRAVPSRSDPVASTR